MNSPRQDATRSWAEKCLGLTPNAPPAQARAALLRMVEREGFVPPPAADYAYRVLTGLPDPPPSDPGWQQAQREIEANLWKEVEQFAERFFKTPPATRQVQWHALRHKCVWIKPLDAYLNLFENTLALVPAQLIGDLGPQAQLAGHVCELFVLRPTRWARRRQVLYEDMSQDMAYWQDAAAEFRTRYPELAALDRDFIDAFADRLDYSAEVRDAQYHAAEHYKRRLQMFASYSFLPNQAAEEAEAAAQGASDLSAEGQPSQASQGPEETPEALWELARQEGLERLAYQRMQEFLARRQDSDDVFVRMYWLLRTVPEVDPERHACHWLALGLRQNWNGHCRELYQREIERRPSEVMAERFTSLMNGPAPLGKLADLLAWRWQAVDRLHRLDVLTADLGSMRPRFAGQDDLLWARLLLRAVDHLGWSTLPANLAVVEGCCRELDALTHVHAGIDLSRLDILRDLTSAWRQPDTFPEAFKRLIPLSWTRSLDEFRAPLLAFLDDLLAQPTSGMAMLDAMKERAPVILGQLGQTVEQLRHRSSFPPEPDSFALQRVVGEFLETTYHDDYAPFRQELLSFFLDEAILPEHALMVLDDNDAVANLPAAEYVRQAQEDWPLRILCYAHCCYWG